MNRQNKVPAFLMTVFLFITVFTLTASAAVGSYGSLVFEGKNGWLFYSGDSTIEDYMGTDLYTLPQLEAMRLHLSLFRDKLALMGCEFVIFIAPNKEQVYSEYMPDAYGPLTFYTRAAQVTDYLRAYGFRVVYPVEELKEAVLNHPEYDFYYRRDTHWNELGSYIGAAALLAELGIDMPSYENLLIEPCIHDSPQLAAQIGRSLMDIGYNVEGYTDHPVLAVQSYPGSVVKSVNYGADERRLLMVGDSFSIAPFSYIGSAFNEITVCHNRWEWDNSHLLTEQPDIFVYEVVERYVDSLNTDYGLK